MRSKYLLISALLVVTAAAVTMIYLSSGIPRVETRQADESSVNSGESRKSGAEDGRGKKETYSDNNTSVANNNGQLSNKVFDNQQAFVMPSENTPLKDVVVYMKQASQKGNYRATCRLAYELNRCSFTRELTRELENKESAKAEGKLKDDSRFEAFKRRAITTIKVCDGVQDTDVQDAWRYSLAAAQTGNPRAIVEYVSTPRNGLALQEAAVVAEGWLAYKNNAPALFQSAIEQGSPEAYYVARTHYGRSHDKFRLVPYDAVISEALVVALRTIAVGKFAEELDYELSSSKLTAQEKERAKTLSVDFARKLTKNGRSNVDFSKGMDPRGDSSFCND
jgi:hypothetical protein